MNREIKFRIWDKRFKTFYYPCFNMYWLQTDSSGNLFYETGVDTKNNYIVQQYTGLKDKFGNEIYEGDLIQYNRQSSYDGINFQVKWSEARWGWVLVSENGDFLANEYTPNGDRYNFIEKVGNIF